MYWAQFPKSVIYVECTVKKIWREDNQKKKKLARRQTATLSIGSSPIVSRGMILKLPLNWRVIQAHDVSASIN